MRHAGLENLQGAARRNDGGGVDSVSAPDAALAQQETVWRSGTRPSVELPI